MYGMGGISNDGKTRRWSVASTRRAPTPKPNTFGQHAGVFFFELMAQFDTTEGTLALLGQETLVLGRLICTLAVVMECAANTTIQPVMVRALLEFLVALRCMAISDG